MRKFAVVKRFNENEIELPERKTAHSAGYDFEVAEDIVIPAYKNIMRDFDGIVWRGGFNPLTLEEVAEITKKYKLKPTLVPTGVKVYLEDDEYLELSVRSSCPLKHWIILANGVGIIDQDYADNIDNDGEIYFQVINLSSFDIQLKKGDIIGQGIIKKYLVTDDDKANGTRVGGFGSTTQQSRGQRANIEGLYQDNSVADILSAIGGNSQINLSSDALDAITIEPDYDNIYSSVSINTDNIKNSIANLSNAINSVTCSSSDMANALKGISKRLTQLEQANE